MQRQHIALYVNRYSLDVGEAGLRAIERLVGAREAVSGRR